MLNIIIEILSLPYLSLSGLGSVALGLVFVCAFLTRASLSVVKDKDTVVGYSKWSLGGVLISLSQAIEPAGGMGGYTIESVTHGQCYARSTVTFPAIEHIAHWPVPIYTAW